MINAQESTGIEKQGRRGLCCGRVNGLFWGIFFIGAGALWLGKKTGLFADLPVHVWPILLIFMGILIVIATVIRRRRLS